MQSSAKTPRRIQISFLRPSRSRCRFRTMLSGASATTALFAAAGRRPSPRGEAGAVAATPRGQAPARGGILPLRRLLRKRRVDVARFLPSRRSLAVGLGLAPLAAGAYLVAPETASFALPRIHVPGAPPP